MREKTKTGHSLQSFFSEA